MKQIQFNQHHRVALFCNSQNEKFCLLEFVQAGFSIYGYHSEKISPVRALTVDF